MGVQPAADETRSNECAGLRAMDVLEHLRVRLHFFRFKVHNLPADHSGDGSRAACNLFNDADARLGGALQPREDLLPCHAIAQTGIQSQSRPIPSDRQVAKIRRAIGFAPTMSLEQIIRSVIAA